MISARTGAGLSTVVECMRHLRARADWDALRRKPALLSIHGLHSASAASGDGGLVLQEDDPELAWLGAASSSSSSPGGGSTMMPRHGGPLVVSGTLLMI